MFSIAVPDRPDSISQVTLAGKEYLIRFTYNVKHDYWSFGLYTPQRVPILPMSKIVPLFPLLHYYSYNTDLPEGIFGAYTYQKRIGRDDFKNRKAIFVFIPNSELGEDYNPYDYEF